MCPSNPYTSSANASSRLRTINRLYEPSYVMHLEVPHVRLMGTAPVETWASAAACDEMTPRGDGSVTSNPWAVNCRDCKRTTTWHNLTRYEARS